MSSFPKGLLDSEETPSSEYEEAQRLINWSSEYEYEGASYEDRGPLTQAEENFGIVWVVVALLGVFLGFLVMIGVAGFNFWTLGGVTFIVLLGLCAHESRYTRPD